MAFATRQPRNRIDIWFNGSGPCSFAADGGQIAISTRAQPLPDRYPELSEILDDIGRTCRD